MPGTEVIIRESAPPPSAPTDTGLWFATGLTQRGPAEALLIRSLREFEEKFGQRVTYSELYDGIETYFREGGARAYISRVIGPAATPATLDFNDAAGVPAATMRVRANSVGEWGNSLQAATVAGATAGTFLIVVSDADGNELQRSPELTDVFDAIGWAESTSRWILVEDIATSAGDPAPAAARSLAGGADDRTGITDTQHQAALDRFARDLGPGQVSAPGRTSTTAYEQLLRHALANNRTALLDAPDTVDEGVLNASLDAVRASLAFNKEYRFGAPFWPRITIPGPVSRTTREISYSPFQAALISRGDAQRTPNEPAAGINGEARWVLRPKHEIEEAPYNRLNDRGLNIGRMIYGRLQTYGWRSLALKEQDPNWWQLGSARLKMFIVALGEAIGRNYVLRQVDGKGKLLSKYGGDLIGMMSRLYEADAVFGETPDQAFTVDTGNQVNTPQSLENGDIRAVISYVRSPNAENVVLELVSKRVTEVI